MISRLRFGLRQRADALRRSAAPRPGALKGCMRNVIVVKPPDKRFQEAVFILRDDYFLSPGADEAELLRQAKEAARDYTLEAAPAARLRLPWLLLGFSLAVVLILLKVLGFL